MTAELIHWHDPVADPPDSDVTVLLHMPTSETEPVWPGYLDGDTWRLADGGDAPPVARWADMPQGEPA